MPAYFGSAIFGVSVFGTLTPMNFSSQPGNALMRPGGFEPGALGSSVAVVTPAHHTVTVVPLHYHTVTVEAANE